MKSQVDYFEKCIKILKELKKEHPDVELSKHYGLAVDGQYWAMSDKELYSTLQKYQDELSMNTLLDKDLQKVIDDTEDLFTEVDEEDVEDFKDGWDNEDY